MGQGQLLAAASALTFLGLLSTAPVRAQGPVYRARWGYLHLENRRCELLRELRAQPARWEPVARALVEPDQGVPFVPVGKALALVRGVAASEAFLLRAAIGVYVLPEVCDPDGENAQCRVTNVSVFLPFTMPAPAELSFDVEAIDAQGKVVFSTRLLHETTVPDLRMARPTARLPCGELPDGTYQIQLRTNLGGVAPVATDPALRWSFHVLRGYQARSEAALRGARAAMDGRTPMEQAVLGGKRGHASLLADAEFENREAFRREQSRQGAENGAIGREPILAAIQRAPRVMLGDFRRQGSQIRAQDVGRVAEHQVEPAGDGL
jgi:hypothetical protein